MVVEELDIGYSGIIQFVDRNVLIKYVNNLIKIWFD